MSSHPSLSPTEQLNAIRAAAADWQRQRAAPNEIAFAAATRALAAAAGSDLPPFRVGTVPAGGVRLRLFQNQRAAVLDCLNDGLVLAIVSHKEGGRLVWPVHSDTELRNALYRFWTFFQYTEFAQFTGSREDRGATDHPYGEVSSQLPPSNGAEEIVG